MTEFEQSLYAALASLPQGKLSTYGQLAKRCGYPNYARQVGKTLSKLPKDTKLPWYRVVNSQGKISFKPGDPKFVLQLQLLQSEGVEFKGKKINLHKHRWQPSLDTLLYKLNY